VYGTIKAHPENLLPLHELVLLKITPSGSRLQTMDMNITIASNTIHASWAQEQVRYKNETLLLNQLTNMLHQGIVPYLNITPDENIPVSKLITILHKIETLTEDDGIRINPPADGHLFYKAFLPNDSWRDRLQRPGQPWELHLAHRDNHLAGTLYQLEETWDTNRNEFVVLETRHPVDKPQQVRDIISRADGQIRVVLIYTRPSLTYGELLQYARPIQTICPAVYIFEDQRRGSQ
jgi:hypothetical protein